VSGFGVTEIYNFYTF